MAAGSPEDIAAALGDEIARTGPDLTKGGMPAPSRKPGDLAGIAADGGREDQAMPPRVAGRGRQVARPRGKKRKRDHILSEQGDGTA